MDYFKKRRRIAAAGVVMQTLLGTVYGWSVFKYPLMNKHGWSGAEVSMAFTLAIFFIGLAASFGGRFVDRAGSRKVAVIAAFLFGLGNIIAGYAVFTGSKLLLYAGYGVIAGIGNGLGYITPIAILVRWFPDKRGMITGLAVMGFGFGGALMGQVAPILIMHFGIATTFYLFGALFLAVLLPAARQMDNPPDDWHEIFSRRNNKAFAPLPSMDFKKACSMNQFYILWLILFINVTVGIALISNLSPMAQVQAGLSPVSAGTLILVGSIFNGAGRIFWSSLSDRLGRRNSFLLMLGTQIPAFIILAHANSVFLFSFLCCYILLCYGGGFATMPSFVADTFGSGNMGGVYGPILMSWGAAGIAGPMMMEYIKHVSSGFGTAMLIAAGMLCAGFVLALIYRKPPQPCR